MLGRSGLHRVGAATYGLCLPSDDPERDTFTYVAAVAVDALDAIPDGMVGVQVPAADYAVFSHDGGIDFEYYDQRFDPQTGTGAFFIHVPIRRRGA